MTRPRKAKKRKVEWILWDREKMQPLELDEGILLLSLSEFLRRLKKAEISQDRFDLRYLPDPLKEKG